MASQPPRSMGKLYGVPELPPHYLKRESDLAGLKEKMLTGDGSVGITGRSSAVSVQGMGGIGKTVLATALAHDPEVRMAFSDGIYWLPIGQKPNLLDLQNQLLRQLTGIKETFTTQEEAKDAIREAIEGKAALLILDDAWTIDHAHAFSVNAPPARLLITTRNNGFLVGLNAEEHRVDVLSAKDALKILAEWVGERSLDGLPSVAGRVVEECGYLPLALAMIGAMVRGSKQPRNIAWQDVLDCLRTSDLEEIKRAFPGYPYPNLLRAIEVSVEGMEGPDRERYVDLAVFRSDQPIPETTLRVLWKLDARHTRACMDCFAERSLATVVVGAPPTGNNSTLKLHDLQHDLIRKRRETELPRLHFRLLKAWDELPRLPDAYAWRCVGYHLAEAGCQNDLRRLLLNFNYLQAKLSVTDANGLIADYDRFTDDEELHLVKSALRLSAHILAHDRCQLAGQLTGRLLGNRTPSIKALLNQSSERKSWPWLRPLQPSLIAAGGPLIRTFQGHTGWVQGVAVTSDSRRAVSASMDLTLRLWDLDSGHTIHILEGHTGRVQTVAVTPDGRRAVSASEDQTLRLWDLETGHTISILEGHTGVVWAVTVTPDGRRAVSASGDQTLRLWDLETGRTIRTLEGHTGVVWAVTLTPDGGRAVSASGDQTLRLWDLKTGQTIRVLQGHKHFVVAVAVTSDGRRAVSASGDQTLRLWDLDSDRTIHTLRGHTDWVEAVAVTPDGGRAVSGSYDNTLRVWDLETGQTLRTFERHAKMVRSLALAPDGRRVVSASMDRKLWLWDLDGSQKILSLLGHSEGVQAVAMTPDGRCAISASRDRTLRLWDLDGSRNIEPPFPSDSQGIAAAITTLGDRRISNLSDVALRFCEMDGEQNVHLLPGHTDEVVAVAITPDGRRAVSVSKDRALLLWDLESGLTIHLLQGHEDEVVAVAVTPDGRCAVSASKNGTLRLWDFEAGKLIHPLVGHTDRVLSVVITPDGRRAVSASEDYTIRLWDLDSGRNIRTLPGHAREVVTITPGGRRADLASMERAPQHSLKSRRGWVIALAVTPDGRRVVSVSEDYTVRFWDLDGGQKIRMLPGHTHEVVAVAITPDGHHAISATKSRTLRLWNLDNGRTVHWLEGHTGGVKAVAVTPDGQRAVSASDDQTLRLWDLTTGKEIAAFIAENEMRSCAVSLECRTIVAGDTSGRVHFLRLVEADKTIPSPGEIKIPLLLHKKSLEQPMPTVYARAIFISYAHTDNESPNRKERWLDRLLEFLKPLERQGDINLCSDRQIKMGEDWHEHIQGQMSGAKAVVLLVSPAFLASDYIANSELPVILKNAADHGVKIFPILIAPSVFKQAKYKYPDATFGPQEFTLASLQSANPVEKTLVDLTEGEQNRVLLGVADQLVELLRENTL